ncbi:MAG: glucose 1-dehydrogenase [Chloroflexota bacterium]
MADPPTALRLDGKVAIVTGGSSGIGAATCRLFAAAGASVVVVARRDAEGETVAASIRSTGGKARFRQTDVSVASDVEALVATTERDLGSIHLLVSVAGVLLTGRAEDTSLEQWRRVLDTNLAGPFHLAKYGVPALRRAGGGAIVLVASELGLVGARESVAYCAAKGGLVNMARALAVDHAPEGIRVNALCPGPIDTPMLRTFFEEARDPASLERAQLSPVPLGRWGTADEIARAALFLASEASAFMTGSVVVSDGGATAWYGL